MLNNKNLLDVLGEEVLKDLPDQQKRVEKQVQATLDVYTYMEAWKANKRIQKKVLKEQQQKAAVQSAVEAVKLQDLKAEGAPMQFIDEYMLASTDEAVCVVCGSGESDENNPIVFCERCETPVHQKCYSISVIPDGDWLCWPCKEYEDGLRLAGGKTDYRFYCEKHSPMMRAKLGQLVGSNGGASKVEKKTGVTVEEFKNTVASSEDWKIKKILSKRQQNGFAVQRRDCDWTGSV
eukprot:jgi/Pico_ML_1/53068/g3682.t1